jgi:hypothetical protein
MIRLICMLQGVGFDTKQSENSELGCNKLPCNFSSFSLTSESLEEALLKVPIWEENFVPYDRNMYKLPCVVYEKPEDDDSIQNISHVYLD